MTCRSLEIFVHDPVGTLAMTLRCMIWLPIVPDRGNLNKLLGTNAGAHSFLAATGQIRARIRELLNSSTLTALVALQVMLIVLIWVGVAHRCATSRTESERWQGGTMGLRWTAAGVLEAERGFRKIAGYRALPKLIAALRAPDAALDRTMKRIDRAKATA
jgi:hypothetical protein